MSVIRAALSFECAGERLVGVLDRPAHCRRGVLLVVGGPQYRVGSHRQFALLAAHLAARGVAVLRFDYRGMGDSTGAARNFEDVDADIEAAIDAMFEAVPGLEEVVIWGLCDAASAALFYAHRDRRVAGLVLLNPWTRSPESEARAYLKHYYWRRLWSVEPWRRLLTGEASLVASARGLAGSVRRAFGHATAAHPTPRDAPAGAPPASLRDRMAEGLARFRGPVLLILSGNDLTAKEFIDVTSASRAWRRLLAAPRVTRRSLPDATHTFSRRVWRDEVAALTTEWVRSW